MSQSRILANLLHTALAALPGIAPEALLSTDPSTIESLLERPKDPTKGDLAFPCFLLAKSLRQAPPKIAAELTRLVEAKGLQSTPFSKVVATGPYVNFFFSGEALASTLIPSIMSGVFLARRTDKKTKVMVEYSQPNTHKAFHVGHIRCAALGDALWRLFDWNGYETIPVNYIGDEGAHVARCLWYYTTQFKGTAPTTNRGEFLGGLYTAATTALDLATYTQAPYPGVVAAKVTEISKHPKRPELSIVALETASGHQTVVTGGTGFHSGDIVAYAPPGVTVVGRTVKDAVVDGIASVGMVCAENEIAVGKDPQQIVILPATTPLGTEVTEIYRLAAAPQQKIISEMLREKMAEVSLVLKKIEQGEPEMKAIWDETKKWSMDELYDIYRWLNCRFDHFFFESECTEPSRKIVEEFEKRGIFVTSEGALGADLSGAGLGFCLLRKRDGNLLYATRDLALAQIKFEKYNIDRSIYVVDLAQKHHFQQVFKTLELMGYQQARKCFHLAYAQVVRPDGKMSSRKGNVILFSELQARLISKIKADFLLRYVDEWPAEEIEAAAHTIALATMRYGMLKEENGTEIVFDLDEWSARSGNTGPYLLYAYARIASMERDGKIALASPADWALLKDEAENSLLLHLNNYHETLTRAAEEYSPSLLCTYLYELCKRFSRMYQSCPILKAETKELAATRLALAGATGRVLKHGLGLLGLRVVERM